MNKKYVLGLLINAVITIFGVVVCIINIFTKKRFEINDIANIILYIGVLYYSIIGYKKPHGNLLKYLMLLYAASLIAMIYSSSGASNYVNIICYAVVMASFAYCAGRLHKIKQNQIIFSVVLAVIIFTIIFSFFQKPGDVPGAGSGEPVVDHQENGSALSVFAASASKFAFLIIAIDLIGAYFARYAEHKEAGLVDSKDYNKQSLNESSLDDVNGGAGYHHPMMPNGVPIVNGEEDQDEEDCKAVFPN